MTAPHRLSQMLPPLTWPEVIDRITPVYERGLPFFDTLPEDIAASQPPQYGGDRFGGFETTVAALAALRGPESVAPSFAMVASSLPYVIEQIGPVVDHDRVLATLFTVSYLNVARCCGGAIPPESPQVELVWLDQLSEQVEHLNERARNTAAFAACAAGYTPLVPIFIDLPDRENEFVPRQRFGADTPAFVSYLVTAIEQGATYAEIQPAWRDFVLGFPVPLHANALGWPALLFAARAVYARIGELPEHEVAPALNRLVTTL